MATLKNDRAQSKAEFLYVARNLRKYTITKCVGFPKRYTFYISQPIANCAGRVYEDVKLANSIYPANQHEAQIRRDYLLRANAELHNLTSQIELAAEMFPIGEDKMKYWMEMVNHEIQLVKGVMDSDKKRYKDLPDKEGV